MMVEPSFVLSTPPHDCEELWEGNESGLDGFFARVAHGSDLGPAWALNIVLINK